MSAAYIYVWSAVAGDWVKAAADADGKLLVGASGPMEVIQDTPADLKLAAHGYESVGAVYVPIAVNAVGKVIIDPTAILEDPPTDGETGKAANSNWSHDHAADVSAHHIKYTDAEAVAAVQAENIIDYDFPRFRMASRYHAGQTVAANPSTIGLANNLYFAIPFLSPITITVTRMAVHVTTSASGSSIRLGIYQDNGSTHPGVLILDAGTVSSTSTGLKAITGLSTILTANVLYWLALKPVNAPTISAMPGASVYPIFGWLTAFNAVAGCWCSVAGAAGAFADPFPSPASIGTDPVPIIAVYW